MPRLALTVRLNTPLNTENTSVVAPPISTPIRLIPSRLAIALHDHADCGGSRHDGRTSHVDELLVTRRLLHDVFEKQIVDLIPAGRQVLPFQDRTDVFRHHPVPIFFQDLLDLWLGFLVAGIDQRQFIRHAESWPWLRRPPYIRPSPPRAYGPSVGPTRHARSCPAAWSGSVRSFHAANGHRWRPTRR